MEDSWRGSSASRVPLFVGMIAVLVWSHGVPDLWPLPPRSDFPLDVQWSRWWGNAVALGLGFAAALLAIFGARYWQAAILITSGYMIAASIPGVAPSLMQKPSQESWQALFGAMPADTLYFQFVVPLYHLVLCVAAVGHAVVKRN